MCLGNFNGVHDRAVIQEIGNYRVSQGRIDEFGVWNVRYMLCATYRRVARHLYRCTSSVLPHVARNLYRTYKHCLDAFRSIRMDLTVSLKKKKKLRAAARWLTQLVQPNFTS